jgi:hypothetical protein
MVARCGVIRLKCDETEQIFFFNINTINIPTELEAKNDATRQLNSCIRNMCRASRDTTKNLRSGIVVVFV